MMVPEVIGASRVHSHGAVGHGLDMGVNVGVYVLDWSGTSGFGMDWLAQGH